MEQLDVKRMQIESLEIRNYRMFRHAELSKLTRFSAFVGENGSGKSTLFDIFSFLKEALSYNVAKAVSRRGGFKELVSRGSNGPISILLKFRETGGRLATYSLSIASDDGKVVIDREVLKFRRGQRGQPWHFVDFSRGHGTAITNETVYGKPGAKGERKAFILDEPTIMAIKGLGQFKEFRVVSEFRNLIENWHISDFHIADARPTAEDGLSEHLSIHGDNVAQVAQYLYENDRETFNTILMAMKERIPGINHVDAKSTEDGRLVLRFHDGSFKDPFMSRYVSDGTIKMFAYLVLLYDPQPFPLLAVEEPENQLYPILLRELSEEFREYARRGGQVFVSTHSPEFLNGLKIDEIFWLKKKDGFTTIYRGADSSVLQCLIDEGDLPGALWRQGVFEGAWQE